MATLIGPVGKEYPGANQVPSITCLTVEGSQAKLHPGYGGDAAHGRGRPAGATLQSMENVHKEVYKAPSPSLLMQVPRGLDTNSITSEPAPLPTLATNINVEGSTHLAPDREPVTPTRSATLQSGLLSPLSGLLGSSNDRVKDILTLTPSGGLGRPVSAELNGEDELGLAPLRNVV